MDCGAVYIPNAFSPNGDNYNDVFYIRGNCIDYMEFVIYDRWGEKVFTGNVTTDGWDGRYRGEMMESGVFYYSLKATLYDESILKKHGTITLIR
jgi:gliding motility-associated-like protein